MHEIDVHRLKTILDEMEYLRVQTFKITGGEPFVVPQLFDIVEYASKKRIHVILLTNATIRLDSFWLNLLSQHVFLLMELMTLLMIRLEERVVSKKQCGILSC